MKLLAGRPSDLEDAEAMSRAGEVNVAEVRTFVEQMAAALGDHELIERLEQLLGCL